MGDTPCANPTEVSLPAGYTPFKAEIGQKTCTVSKLNDMINDPRYVKNNYRANMLDLQEDNGVMNVKIGTFGMGSYRGGGYDYNQDSMMLKNIYLDLWSRPTLSWKLECESNPETTRAKFYQAFGDRYEFPTRITVAMVFAFIGMTVEICAGGCSIAQGGLKDEDISYTFRLGATVCGLIFAINMIWMANTAATTIKNSSSSLHSLEMINDCADEYTELPVDKIT